MALKLVTAPSGSLLDVDNVVKPYLRISGTADDAFLASLVLAATDQCEKYLSRRFLTQTWKLVLDSFPCKYNTDRIPEGITDGALCQYLGLENFINIPLMPLASITAVNTYDDTDAQFVMPTSDYYVDTNHEPGRLTLRRSATWPATVLRPTSGVEIIFTVGYGAAADVPSGLRQAVLDLVTYYYQNRGCDLGAIPTGVTSQLEPFRVWRI